MDLKTAQFREHIRIYYFEHFGYSWSEHLCHIAYVTKAMRLYYFLILEMIRKEKLFFGRISKARC